jgi:hypothetical protein
MHVSAAEEEGGADEHDNYRRPTEQPHGGVEKERERGRGREGEREGMLAAAAPSRAAAVGGWAAPPPRYTDGKIPVKYGICSESPSLGIVF